MSSSSKQRSDEFEAKRNVRWQVVREVKDKVENVRKAVEEDRMESSGDLKAAKGRWFHMYKTNSDKTWNAHMALITSRLEEQRAWRQRVWDRSIKPIHVVKPPPMDTWRRNVWPRNFYCELCMGVAGPGADVLDCCTCNVVMHFRCVTSRFGQYQLGPREWQCEFCRRTRERDELEYEEAVRRKEMVETRFNMAIKMQSLARTWLVRRRYREFLKQLAKAQALVRMWLQQRKFRTMINSYVRLYKIKLLDVTDMTPLEADAHGATFFLVLSIISHKHRQGDELHYIDPGQQKYRFETSNFHYNTHVRLNTTFLIPGSTNQVLFAFTLVRREGVRNEFWGQAFVEGTSVLDKRGKVRLNFGDLKFEPRDRKNIVPLKTRVLDEERTITGHMTAEIQPLSHSVCKCSIIFEVPELGKDDTRSKLRQWWACLVDNSLLLFKKLGDSLPYRSVTVLRVSWYNRTSIRVGSVRGEDTVIFTCPDADMRSDWYNKLRLSVEQAHN